MRVGARRGVWLAAIGVGVATAGALGVAVVGDDGVAAASAGPSEWRLVECAACHAEIDAQWRDSQHAKAWTDPIVQAEVARTPAATCKGCHAPTTAASELRGIDCASCHVRDGVLVAARPSFRGVLAHPVRAEPAMDGVDACARCHQFAFADDGFHDPNELLQDTVGEWRRARSTGEDRSCQGCHMPTLRDDRGVARTSHALRGLDDPTLLRDAVRVAGDAVRRPDGIAVNVELAGHRIGHAFPTGDVFREAILTLRTDGGASDAVVLRRWLARTIDADGNGHHLRTVDDTRVPPPGTGTLRDEVVLDDVGATTVHWELRLHRLSADAARTRGLADHIDGIPVAAGEIAVRGAD